VRGVRRAGGVLWAAAGVCGVVLCLEPCGVTATAMRASFRCGCNGSCYSPAMRRYLSAVRVNSAQVAISCPYCHRVHLHGAVGPALGDGDGHRLPHCVAGPGTKVGAGYAIRERTARSFVARLLMDAGFSPAQASHILDLAIRNYVPRAPVPALPPRGGGYRGGRGFAVRRRRSSLEDPIPTCSHASSAAKVKSPAELARCGAKHTHRKEFGNASPLTRRDHRCMPISSIP
jgi:hypothetical protein